ncbi:MAG: hypothetical protein ACOYN4_01725 [Bacteroidales bacterium]
MAKITEKSSVSASGCVTFANNLSRLVERVGFEKRFFPTVLIGSYLWEHAYSAERKPIHTGSQGTVFLPAEIQRHYCRLRLDSIIKESFKRKGPEVDISLITSISTFSFSMRVHKINYQLLASHQRSSIVIFESGLIIENKKTNPKVSIFQTEFLQQKEWFMRHK